MRGLVAAVAVGMLMLRGTADAAPDSTPSARARTLPVPPLIHRYLFAVETDAPGPDLRCAQFYGYVLEDDGELYWYDDSCDNGSRPVSAPDGLQTQDDLDERYALRRVLIARIDEAEVRRRAGAALPASWGTLTPAPLNWASLAPDSPTARLYHAHTTRTFVAYLFTPATSLYRRVPLRVLGARNASSNAQAASELAAWLDKVIDPDARGSGIAPRLAALPVESLDIGCSGGIAGGSSSITIDRFGLVTVRDTRPTHPRADRVWNIPPSDAAALLEEATRDRIMQRNLKGGIPDDACWLGATIGSVRHELGWSGGDLRLPADVQRLFEAVQALAGASQTK